MKEVKHVILPFGRLSRLSRNPVDGWTCYLCIRHRETPCYTILQPRTYRNTPDDKMVLAIELAISQEENNDDLSNASERRLRGKARQMANTLALAPIGYLNAIIRLFPGDRNIIPDPDKASLVINLYSNMAANGLYSSKCLYGNKHTRYRSPIT